jgi:hypothetical protein
MVESARIAGMLSMLPMLKNTRIIVIIALFLYPFMGCSHGDRELCHPRPPSFDGEGAGYELINIVGREVWATRNWSPKDYADFSFPFSWFYWRKNDPRIALADRGKFLKSPACAEGRYSYMRAFDREFVQVVRLISINNRIDDLGLIRKTELEKHHILHYDAGRTVSVLQSPNGESYIGVSRSLERSLEPPSLPDGWTLTERLLSKDIQVELFGKVSVLRMNNEDSYQGPISEKIIHEN